MSVSKKLIFLISAVLIGHGAYSQEMITHHGVIGDGYDFWVSLPENCTPSDSVKVPTIMFLHGRSLCGNDLNKVLRYGCLDALKYNLNIPALVIAPQNPGTAWNPRKLLNVLEWVEQHYPVDTNRVYVLGMSLGGYGTLDFAGNYPDKVAAAMALCGGSLLKDYSGLNEVPLWIIHGYDDKAVSWKESQKVVTGMAAAGDTTRLRYDFMEKVDHGRLARCFYLQDSYDWLFSHSLQDSARVVNRDYSITHSSLENAYKQFYGQPKKTRTIKNYDKKSGTATVSVETVTPEKVNPKYITVKKGDSLSKIASREHTTISKLCSLNGIKKNAVIIAGKKLRVR